MYIKTPASSILIQTNTFEIRKMKETDYLAFLAYIGNDGDAKGYQSFRDAIDYDDMLALFMGEEIGALFLMYDEPHSQLKSLEDEGVTIGFNCTEKCYNEGIMKMAYGLLVDHLLEVDVDFVAGKCDKDHVRVYKIMAENGLVIFDEDGKNYYMIKMY